MSKHLPPLKIVVFLLAIFFFNNVQGQTPQQLNYQAVARKADGSPISFQDITVRISIIDSATSGFPSDRVPYAETRKVKTNFAGLFNIVIGGPDALSFSGALKNVNWVTGKKFIRVEIDPAAGNNYILLGLTELQSVPYALFALNSNNSSGSISGAASGDLTGSYPSPSIAAKVITTEKLADSSITLQKLSSTIQTTLSNAISVSDTAAMLKGYAKTGNLSALGVTAVSVSTLNGITGAVTNANSLPSIQLGLGDITPNSVVASSGISAVTLSGVIKTASQPFITNIGQLNSLTIVGLLQAGSIGGTLINATQPNITSVGILTDLSVNGTVKTGNLNTSNANISNITGLNALTLTGTLTTNSLSSVSGLIGNLSIPGTITTGSVNATNANLTNISGLNALTVTGTLTSNSLSAVNGLIGNLSIPGTLTTGSVNATNANLTNISGLNALTVTGTLTSNSLSAVNGLIGNLSIPGTLTTGSVNATNANLTNISGLNGLTVTGALISNSLSSTEATIKNLSVSGTIAGGVLSGLLTGTLQSAAQPNITSIGQLTTLSVSGTVTSGVLSGILSSETQRNITGLGTLSNLSVAGTVESNTLSASTITTSRIAGLKSLTVSGTIEASSLTVSGNITTGSISAGNATLTGITGLSLPSGTLSDTFVTISGGVLKQTVFVPTDATFASDFTVTGVANYLKWADGENVPARGLTAVQLLQLGAVKSIHPTYNTPTLSMGTSPAAGNVEIGSNISVTLSSNFTQNDGGAATSTTYKKGGVNMGSNTDNITNITSAVSYSVSVDYGQGTCKNDNLGVQDCTGRIASGTVNSSSVTYTPLGKRYWGYASTNAPTDTDIKNATGGGSELSNTKVKSSFSITPPGANYIFFAYPASLGTLTSISVGGFESISAFTLTTRTVINASGYSQSYNIYVSNNTFSSVVSAIITN